MNPKKFFEKKLGVVFNNNDEFMRFLAMGCMADKQMKSQKYDKCKPVGFQDKNEHKVS